MTGQGSRGPTDSMWTGPDTARFFLAPTIRRIASRKLTGGYRNFETEGPEGVLGVLSQGSRPHGSWPRPVSVKGSWMEATSPKPSGARSPLPAWEWRGVYAMAAILGLGLLMVAGRYGYSRDELYFLACARHLAWGYPDQPPLVPLIARFMVAIAPNSVTVLRRPAIASAMAVVILTALIAREFGGGRKAQGLAAAVMTVSVMVLVSGHLLETSTIALPLWALLIWLVQRAVRARHDRLWLVIGAVAGVALMESDLVLGLMGAIVLGLLLAGPRRIFRTPWIYAGAGLALAMWSPYVFWQAAHGWPELAVAHGIATGHSGTSTPRWAVLPGQLEMVTFMAPVIVAGAIRLVRGADAVAGRMWAVAYGILALGIEIAGGKDYYLSLMIPLLVAAGAEPTVNWASRGRRRLRGGVLAAGFVASLVLVPVALPVLPVQELHNTPVVAINSTMGEEVGWPTFVQEIATVYHSLPQATQVSTIILASNYGEAGAVNQFGPADGLPAVYSGHMSYWYWGPPPAGATTAVAVGFSRGQLSGFCGSIRLATHLNNHLQVKDEEQGNPVYVCSHLRVSWKAIWPRLKTYG